MEQQKPLKSQGQFRQGLPVVNHHAAGIDIGDSKHDIAIFDKNGGIVSRECSSFTADLEGLVTWLCNEGITTVAMESTGVYWLCLFLMLEEAGIEPYLVNAQHVKNVTGRKKDDTDAIWILKLHSCGLLQKSFQPDFDTRTLRTYVRQRKKLISLSSDSTRRMQKSLELMNIKLHIVISDILGKTGMEMVCAILDGERDPEKLLLLKDPRVKASEGEIKKALNGVWKDEHLFTLRQHYNGYKFYQSQIEECDAQIEKSLLAMAAKKQEGDISGLGAKKKPRKNEFAFHARPILEIVAGVDLCEIDGISETSAVELISEIGTDMEKWASSKHFVAWLNLAPNTKITGGKQISSKMQKKKNHAGQTLRMACCSLSKSKEPIGDYARKMKSRLGKKGGVVATAHKLGRIIYTMIKDKAKFDKTLIKADQEKWKLKKIEYLENQLKMLKTAS